MLNYDNDKNSINHIHIYLYTQKKDFLVIRCGFCVSQYKHFYYLKNKKGHTDSNIFQGDKEKRISRKEWREYLDKSTENFIIGGINETKMSKYWETWYELYFAKKIQKKIRIRIK